MSAAKRPAPLTSGGSSSRSTDCPIHWLLLVGAVMSAPAVQHARLYLPLQGGGRLSLLRCAKQRRSGGGAMGRAIAYGSWRVIEHQRRFQAILIGKSISQSIDVG